MLKTWHEQALGAGILFYSSLFSVSKTSARLHDF